MFCGPSQTSMDLPGGDGVFGTLTVTAGGQQFLIDMTNTGWGLYLATSGCRFMSQKAFHFHS
jgi:hypothetical protein